MSVAAECAIGGCGVQAIGRCYECSQAFCLTHQERKPVGATESVPYVDFCTACGARRAADAVTARKTREQEVLDRLLAITDPLQRLVVTLQTCAWVSEVSSARETFVKLKPEWNSVAVEACPILADATYSLRTRHDLMKNPPWDGDEIASWFATRAAEGGVPTSERDTAIEQRGLLGRSKRVAVKQVGWRLPWGASSRRRGDYSNMWEDAFVVEDGQLVGGNLNGWGVVQMGRLLGFAPV